MAQLPTFRRHTIYTGEPAERVLCLTGDLNGDGVPEIVVGSRRPRAELLWLGREPDGTWQAHPIDAGFETLESGGVLYDLDGDGDLDLIGGHDFRGNRLLWWECPDDPRQPWTRREILQMPANKSHDQLLADLDGDGRPELYFWNQGARTLFCVPVPDDPRVSPWPGVRPVVTDVLEEGMAVADVDGEGRPELLAGLSWYRPPSDPGGACERHEFAQGYVAPRLAAADFDGDGRVEIALAEGDASLNKREFGRLVRFHPPADPAQLWRPELLHERLLDPHSLAVADFDGDGRPDLFVGELGMPRGDDPHPPALRIYLSRGGRFAEHVIDEGAGVHDARALTIDGRPAIAGKPFRSLTMLVPRTAEADSVYLWLPE